MSEFLVIIASAVSIFVNALSYILLARALLQFFASEESKAYEFCYAVTEPVVSPIRTVLSRIQALDGLPVDFSFVATFLVLMIIRLLLPPITNLIR